MAVERGNSNSSAFQLQINYTTGTGTFKINSVLGKRTDGYSSEGTLGLKVTVSSQNSNSSGLINTQTDTVTGYFGNRSWGGSNRWMFNGSNFGHNQVSGITASTIYVYITITSTFNSKIPVNSYWTFSTSITPVVTSKTVTVSHWTFGWQNGEGNNGDKTAYNLAYTTFQANPGSSVTFDTSRGVSYPRGFYLSNSCSHNSYNNGTWRSYDMPVTLTQPNSDTGMQYSYPMVNYNINYKLNGGTNNANNPTYYTTPYGVNLQTPTRTGYTFKGWTVVYDVGDMTLAAGSNAYKWEVFYGNVQPGEDITIKIESAELTAGSASYYTMRMYDFTSNADIGNIVLDHCHFGTAQEYHFIAPSSIDGSHHIAIIGYAGISGSTTNNTVVFKGINVMVKNTSKINRGENITFSSVSDLTTKVRYKNAANALCIANWQQAESYIQTSILPEGYTQVDYIEGTGTQYINTSYYHKTNLTDYELEFAITDITTQYQTLFGARTTYNGAEAYYVGWGSDAPVAHAYTCIGGHNGSIRMAFVANQQYHMQVWASTGLLVDDSMFNYWPYTTATTHTQPDLIFGMDQGGSPIELGKFKLYSFKIFESGVLQRNYIPCYRNNDNKPGLYDLVTDAFFSNAGTGEFTIGPVTKWNKGKVFYKSEGSWVPGKKIYRRDSNYGKIPLATYKIVDYVASGGTSPYMNLNFSDADGIKIIAKVQYDSLAESFGTLCGSQELVDNCSNGANALIMQKQTQPFLIWYCGTSSTNLNSHFELQYNAFVIEASSIKGNSYIKIGDAIQYFTDTNTRGTRPIYLFALNNGGSPGYYGWGKIFWLKMYDHNGTLVRDLVPCQRLSDDIVGFYDLVNDYFYVNQGGGTFITSSSNTSDWHEGRNE